MSRSDAFVVVTCDECGTEDHLELTALARGSWDERGIHSRLLRDGWMLTAVRDICHDCVEELNAGPAAEGETHG